MLWSPRPTCHRQVMASMGQIDDTRWMPASDAICHEYCSYCGSMKPEALVEHLESGARLELADMKYGWPHKFYATAADGGHIGKFYTAHITDYGIDREALSAITAALKVHGGVELELLGDGMRWRILQRSE